MAADLQYLVDKIWWTRPKGPDLSYYRRLLSRLHRNSTGGTGTHSAGKLTKTEVSGKEDS